MSRRVWFIYVLLLIAVFPTGAHAQQATAPASQPAEPQKIGDALAQTQLGKIIQGTKALNWDEVLSPGFWKESIQDLAWTLLSFIPRFLGTLLFLFVFWLVYRGIRKMAVRNMKKGEVDSSIRDLLGSLIKWAVMGFGIVIACNQLGIPIVAMLTGVSIIGLAVGFAAQETLANFIAGIVIFLDKPFKIGDWLLLGDEFGQVKRVTFRSTRLLTLDGDVIVIPNTQILSNKFSNHSTHPINRVNIPIGIAYKCSIDDARRTLLALVKDDARIVKDPAPEVIVKDLGESSVNLVLRFWISDESIERRIGYEYTEKAKKAFDAANIEIPFPHMQLFLEQTPALSNLLKKAG
jgi:small conductance mechanosensitive channel